jgi:serine/threonine protein kinase
MCFKNLIVCYQRKKKRKKRGKVANLLEDQNLKIILSEIHSRGVIHRDIKPHNIIVTPNNQLCIIDFGSACQRSAKTEFLGAHAYASRNAQAWTSM